MVHCRPHVAHPQPYPVPSDAPGSWKDVVAEAPFVVQKNGTVTILYSGDGAQTVHYAMGLCFYAGEGDMEAGENWIDYNASVKADPEFSFDLERACTARGWRRWVSSPDGREDWMYYHTKMFSTWNLQGGSEETQDSKEMWARRISCRKSAAGVPAQQRQGLYPARPWAARCRTVPEVPASRRRESARMGCRGSWRRSICCPSATSWARRRSGLQATAAASIWCGKSAPMPPMAATAAGSMCWRTVRRRGAPACISTTFPAARRLTLAAGSPYTGAGFELWINGRHAGDIAVPETGGFDRFAPCSLEVSIPEMATIALVYRRGKNQEAGVDYLLLE